MNELTQYDELKAQIDNMRQKCNFLPDVTTDEGYEKSKRVALDAGKILTAVEKTRKTLKADALEYGRKVDSEAKLIVAEIEEFQLPHKEAYKELDKLKKEREAERKAKLESRVDEMRNIAELMRECSSDEIGAAYDELMKEECLDFYEFTDQALKARNSARQELSSLFERRQKEEADAAELEKLRKAQAEQEKKEHEERIANQAREEAERKAAEEAAKIEAEKQAAIDAKLKAEEDAKQAERDRIAAEEKAKADAEAARIRAEEDKARAVEAEINRQMAEQIARDEEIAKREANKRHVGNIRREAKEAIMAAGVDEATAKAIVLAINSGAIPHVTINY